MLYTVLKLFVPIFFKIFFFFESEGEEFIPRKGGVILASNHLSYLDPIALGVAAPRRLSFMAKEELFRNRFFSFLIRILGAFPVKRGYGDIKALRNAVDIVKGGKVLVVFPQGTRTSRKEDGIKPGIGIIVRKSGVPVVCCRIRGTDIVLPSEGKKIHLFRKIKVSFSEPLHFGSDMSPHDIAEKILEAIYSL